MTTSSPLCQLKLKLADFTLLTRQTTLHEPTDDGQAIYRAASALLVRAATCRARPSKSRQSWQKRGKNT